jgi:hypothetical protein
MARGKKKVTRRRRFKGVNVTDAALGYVGVSIWSEALLGVNPIQFFTKQPASSSTGKLNIYEIIDGLMGGDGGVNPATVSQYYPKGTAPTAFGIIEHNARTRGLEAVAKSIGLGIAGTVGKKVTKKPRATLNKLIREFGFGDMIRF